MKRRNAFTVHIRYRYNMRAMPKCLHHVTKPHTEHFGLTSTAHEGPGHQLCHINRLGLSFIELLIFFSAFTSFASPIILISNWSSEIFDDNNQFHFKRTKNAKTSASHIRAGHEKKETAAQKPMMNASGKRNSIIKSNRLKIKINRAKPKQTCCVFQIKNKSSKSLWLLWTKRVFQTIILAFVHRGNRLNWQPFTCVVILFLLSAFQWIEWIKWILTHRS